LTTEFVLESAFSDVWKTKIRN